MEKTKPFLTLICWIAAIGGFLFGFDMAIISGVLPFMQKQFDLSASQEGWLVSSALVGCIVGVAASGTLSDRLGRKKLLVAAAVFFLLSAVGSSFLPSFATVIWARIIGGVGVGIASNIVPLYISEIAPAHKRGRYVTYYQLAVTLGILIAYLSNYGLLILAERQVFQGDGFLNYLFVDEVWRGMFIVGTIPAILFLFGLFFAPESPRWLIQTGKKEAGTAVLLRIMDEESARNDAEIISDNAVTGKTSFKDLLAPEMRRPLWLGLLLPLFSQFCGINAIIYYGPTILNSAGISLSNSFQSQIIFGLANVLFTFIAIWKVDQLGRRPLYLVGTFFATVSLFLTGVFFFMGEVSGLLILMVVTLFLASFAFSIGPLKFVVASEIFPTHIRGRALGLSVMVMWVADALVGQFTAVLLREAGTAYTFWLFGFFSAIAFVVVYKLLPETKGKSLEEIETFWKKDTAIVDTLATQDDLLQAEVEVDMNRKT